MHSLGLPYTISVLNLAYAETATLALSLLSDELLTLIEANATWKTVLDSTRLLSQVFTSDTDHMNEVSEDFYVDLVDWLKDLEDNVADPLVFEKIGELRAILTDPEQLIWRSYSMSGTMTEDYNKDRIGFDGVHGVSIYYPIHRNSETYEDYQEDQLFQFTQKSSWPVFLDKQLLALDGGKPLDPTPPPFPLLEIPPTTTDKQLFLPLISR